MTGQSESARRWRVTAQMRFPVEMPLAPGGGPPERLQPISRVPTQSLTVRGMPLSLSPLTAEDVTGTSEDPRWSWAALDTAVQGSDANDAIQRAVDGMEPVIESLSYQLQEALQLDAVTAIDITPPVEVGDERDFSTFPLGSGYPLRRFRPAAIQMAGVVTTRAPDLRLDLSSLNRRQRAAIDWYLKALATPWLVDHFMFLWIAVEILSDISEHAVEAPYRARCGHQIPECPECGQPTTQKVRGPSHQAFLTGGFGVNPPVARDIWDARQIMHGAKQFDSAVMDRLAELSQVLRAVVNEALKRALQIADDEPPMVASGQFSIGPQMGLGGTTKVKARDLEPL